MEILSGSLIYNVLKDISKYRGKFISASDERAKSNLEEHIIWASGWSKSIQMLGMTKAVAVDQTAISLSISDRPRKFISSNSAQKIISYLANMIFLTMQTIM